MQLHLGLEKERIHQGDCIQLMQKMAAGSVDLVFADPPFNIGYEYDQYDDRQESDKYLAWSKEWISAVHRILKPNGTFWLAIGDEYAAELKLIAQKEAGLFCRSWVIWYYTFGVNCVRGFSRSHTHLLHFVKDESDFTFNSENPAVRVLSARQLVYADGRANPKGRLPDNTWFYRPQDIPNGFLPTHDAWYFARVAGTFKEREGFHGCQMPEQLLGRIIRVSSNPSELVLDPFAGSGTTLAVAKKLGRQWMGFELSAEYARRITKRLKNTMAGDSLDGPTDPLRSAPKTADGRKRGRKSRGNVLLPSDKETIDGVISAYKKAGRGSSTDYILCHPDLNSSFVEACKKIGLAGNAFTWNRLLLRARKSGRLPRAKRKQRRMRLTFQQMDKYSFASEIAMRFMELDYGLTLDDVLCRPEVAQEFDQMARQFSPGYSSFEYRWAALAIRKRSSQSCSLAALKFRDWLKKALPKSRPIEDLCSSKYECPGVYIVQSEGQPLYVGETINVKERIDRVIQSDCWSMLQPTSARLLQREEQLHGLQSVLISRSKPLLNTHLLWQDMK
jgi:site-specific DNA-methyltransferase (adenine-specific)